MYMDIIFFSLYREHFSRSAGLIPTITLEGRREGSLGTQRLKGAGVTTVGVTARLAVSRYPCRCLRQPPRSEKQLVCKPENTCCFPGGLAGAGDGDVPGRQPCGGSPAGQHGRGRGDIWWVPGGAGAQPQVHEPRLCTPASKGDCPPTVPLGVRGVMSLFAPPSKALPS